MDLGEFDHLIVLFFSQRNKKGSKLNPYFNRELKFLRHI